jgi:hypothetical protein
MQDKFILDLERNFKLHSFNVFYSFEQNLYVQETNTLDNNNHIIKITELSETEPAKRHFKILNPDSTQIGHICIDGDFIPYGQAKYDLNSKKYSDGRPDSLVFSPNTLIFLELKVEQDDATFGKKDDVKWRAFFKGVTQIEDFVRFLNHNSFKVKDYFTSVEAVICMRFEPKFVSNTSRNTELLKRAVAIGFRISPHKNEDKFIIQ